MKYRLKDRELQKKLDEISGGAFLFSDALNKACNDINDFDINSCPPIRICFGQTPGLCHAFEVYFEPNQIESVKEYNPNAWNDYPEVTPPEDVLMATEFYWSQKDFEEECPCRSCWMFKNGKWHWMDGRDCLVDYGWKNIRFRPWSQ